MSNRVRVGVKKLHPDAIIPKKATPGAACVDLHAIVENNTQERPFATVSINRPTVFRTGLAFEIPEGYGMLIFSRSGHGFKNDIRLSNCVGVIDHDYKGEVMVKLASDNPDCNVFSVYHHDRIAQALVLPIPEIEYFLTEELSESERGTGGFGSTGGSAGQ